VLVRWIWFNECPVLEKPRARMNYLNIDQKWGLSEFYGPCWKYTIDPLFEYAWILNKETDKESTQNYSSQKVFSFVLFDSFELFEDFLVNPCGKNDQLFVNFNFAKNGWAKRS